MLKVMIANPTFVYTLPKCINYISNTRYIGKFFGYEYCPWVKQRTYIGGMMVKTLKIFACF